MTLNPSNNWLVTGRYRDVEGYEVIVLEPKTDWIAPWWTWLILGVFILMVLTCITKAFLKAIGVITEDREAKYDKLQYIVVPYISWTCNILDSKLCYHAARYIVLEIIFLKSCQYC